MRTCTHLVLQRHTPGAHAQTPARQRHTPGAHEEIIETLAAANPIAEPQRRKFELLRRTFALLKG